jgi:hypothetical protein
MKHTIKSTPLWAVFAAALLVTASAARAQIYTLHDGESGSLDFVTVQVVSGDHLDTTAAFRYDPDLSPMPGWTQQSSGTSAYATFASTDSIDFDVALIGTDQTANANLVLYGFSGDTEVFRETMVLGPNDPSNGGGNSSWSGEYLPTDSTTREELMATVPEPTTAGCFLLGLGALVCFQRFTQKRRS